MENNNLTEEELVKNEIVEQEEVTVDYTQLSKNELLAENNKNIMVN